jgi:nucleotide-binding universal stress UspA family protein
MRFTHHIQVGDKAEIIANLVERLRRDRIVMGTARKNSLTRLLQDSAINGVLDLTVVPVKVITGRTVPLLERVGVPAGMGGTMALVALAID